MSLLVLTAVMVILVVARVIRFRRDLKKLGGLPGLRSALSPITAFGALLPTSRFNLGMSWQWEWRNQVYQHHRSETISMLSYLFGRPLLFTSSIEVARQILSTKGPLEKGEDTTSITLMWGNNVLAANGEEWRRHRRIIGPAFNSKTYSLVWEQTASTYRDMTASEGWDNLDEITIPAINHLTRKFALMIISKCGFGQDLPWNFDKTSADNMTFAKALSIVSGSMISRLVVPRWMYKLPIQRLRDIENAYLTLDGFMRSLISERRAELLDKDTQVGRDVFSLMIDASEKEGKLAMNDDELRGNTFVLLFAGHETTAHILAAAVGFLALYEDIQEEVYAEIQEVAPGIAQATYADNDKLMKVSACFLEAARLFPAAFLFIRDTTEAMILTTYGEGGATGQIALEPGTRLAVDVVGMHYNPRHFSEPEEFRPSRWYNAAEDDLTMFAMGSRPCIGRRFAITEATCFLTMLLQEWKLEIILQSGETRPEWRKRVMRGVMTMTLGVGEVPVRLVRRG